MSDLTSILIQLQFYREILEKDIETVPFNTRPSFEISRREAQDNIVALTKEYGEKLFSSSICFCPSGPSDKVKSFVEVAVQEAPSMIVADVDDLYNVLADKIWPSMEYQGQFTIDCFSTLVRELKYIAMDLGVAEIMSPKYGEPFACSKKAELDEYVSRLVREAMGDELNKLYLRKQIVDKAIVAEHAASLPVILINATAEEAKAFSEMFKVFAPISLSTSTEITPDFAISTFKKFSKKQAKKTKVNTDENTDETE